MNEKLLHLFFFSGKKKASPFLSAVVSVDVAGNEKAKHAACECMNSETVQNIKLGKIFIIMCFIAKKAVEFDPDLDF